MCALHADGSPRRHANQRDGVALQVAKRRKVATYPELVGPGIRAKLVVLAVEVGGRWSDETRGLPESTGEGPSEGRRDSFDETTGRTGMETPLGRHVRVRSCEGCRIIVAELA